MLVWMEENTSAVSSAQRWLVDFRSSCEELFHLILEETRQTPRSLDPTGSDQLQTVWNRLHALQSQLPGIVEELERHKERELYLEYLMQVEKDLDRRNATVLEKLLHALETLHTSLEEARPILQSSSLSRKPSLSDVLSLAVRITSSLSAPMNYDEEYANTVQFAPAPTEEMIRASKLAQWDM